MGESQDGVMVIYEFKLLKPVGLTSQQLIIKVNQGLGGLIVYTLPDKSDSDANERTEIEIGPQIKSSVTECVLVEKMKQLSLELGFEIISGPTLLGNKH